MRKLIFSIFLFLIHGMAISQDNYPEPKGIDDLLFYIQHNRSTNTYVYALNFDKNKELNRKTPICVTRQLFENDGEILPLTNIQKRYAYGIKSEELENHSFELKIVSLPEQKLYLHIPKSGNPYILTSVNGVKLRLERIFLKLKEGTWGLGTKVEYILFYGKSNNKYSVQKLIL